MIKDIKSLALECENEAREVFKKIDSVSYSNTEKVLRAFSDLRLSERHFAPSTGYGYNDDGRDLCDKAFALCFDAEDGFARHNIVSGTHAITVALFGLLRPGDTMLSVTGTPYDTLHNLIGLGDTKGSGTLTDFGITYRQTEMCDFSTIDYRTVEEELRRDKTIKVVYLQRSKGYLSRRSLPAREINELYELVRRHEGVYLVVDNCYGEFCETAEPKADILVGSLIKNPGGGMADTGGYIVGTKRAVELASYRLNVPGLGTEAGASLGQTRNMLKGLFYAPHTTAQALKTAVFASLLFSKMGYAVSPLPDEERADIIQTVNMDSADSMLKFCRGIQSGSPIDSHVIPEGWLMPGYNDEVVMAAGAFTQGASIEFSADGPLRPPYTVYMQGGLTYESGKYGLIKAAEELVK